MSIKKSKVPIIIGEGSYGCAYKPSLRCTKKNIKYNNKISKLITTENAKKEMDEYKVISKIDKNKNFFLGIPINCKFNHSLKSNISSLKKCKSKNFKKKMKKLDLLIMENGGIDIDNYSYNLRSKAYSPENIKKAEQLLIEFHRLLLGIRLFIESGIIHHDLKPQNIVYDESKNRLNFIDFGLTRSKTSIIRSCLKSENWLAEYHWSFPLEMKFLNKHDYLHFCSKTKEEKESYYNNLFVKSINTGSSTTIANIIRLFFSYVIPSSNYNEHINVFLKELFDTLIHEYHEKDYRSFLDKSIDSIDIYGLGISFLFFLKNTSHLLKKKLKDELYDLFYQMVRPNFNKRINIEMLIKEFEIVLEQNNILKKYNKRFENNKLVDGYTEENMLNIKDFSIIKLSRKIQVIESIIPPDEKVH